MIFDSQQTAKFNAKLYSSQCRLKFHSVAYRRNQPTPLLPSPRSTTPVGGRYFR